MIEVGQSARAESKDLSRQDRPSTLTHPADRGCDIFDSIAVKSDFTLYASVSGIAATHHRIEDRFNDEA